MFEPIPLRNKLLGYVALVGLLLLPLFFWHLHPVSAAPGATCTGQFLSVSQPLNDLGNQVYMRMDGQNTGEIGGLYPGGTNLRPPAHTAAGVALAHQITPLGTNGQPDNINGRIVMISVGMSNTYSEFQTFIDLARNDPQRSHRVAIVNGAQPGMTAPDWVDPTATTWQVLNQRLASGGLSPAQVEVAWVKLTLVGTGPFPAWPQSLQNDLEAVACDLKTLYPNIKLAYFSSRTRSYTYWAGLNPEPSAFETGFAVRWLIEKQLNGDPSLNFLPANGPVVAPFLSWGPYLWIDGTNPRSDGRVWLPEDMVPDCTHPSDTGNAKVAEMLLEFFKNDATSVPWFLTSPLIQPNHVYLPAIPTH